jgi:hypothetical protein
MLVGLIICFGKLDSIISPGRGDWSVTTRRQQQNAETDTGQSDISQSFKPHGFALDWGGLT